MRDNKDAFGKWRSTPSTEHLVFTASEGVNPGIRCSKQNPLRKLHGLVSDFDAKITDAMCAGLLDRAPADLRPAWLSRTMHSGGVRLVWLFQESLPLDVGPLADAFVRVAFRELKAMKLFAGADESAFYDLTKLYDVGRDWQKISEQTIPTATLHYWLTEAARMTRWSELNDINIPIDAVAQQVEDQFPGRWQGEFEVGKRGVVFFNPNSVNPTAAIVTEAGMICFGEAELFHSWAKIFGASFIRKFQQDKIGAAVANVWYDGKAYYRKSSYGVWEPTQKEDFIALLKVNHSVDAGKSRGETASEMDKALVFVQEHRRVSGVVPKVFETQELLYFNGRRFLNCAAVNAMTPADIEQEWGDNFPWLAEFMESAWDKALVPCVDPKRPPMDAKTIFLAWWKRFYCSALAGALLKGQALFLAGGVNRGKGQPYSGIVQTPSGPRQMGDLSVGGLVVGGDGRPTTVEEIFELGEQNIFRVSFSDGASLRVTGEHLWALEQVLETRPNRQRHVVRDTNWLRNRSRLKKRSNWKYKIPQARPIEYCGQEIKALPLDPYLLGTFLANGSSRSGTPDITTSDAWVIRQCSGALPGDDQFVRKTNTSRSPSYYITGGATKTALTELGLWSCRSWEKFLPKDYLFAALPARLALFCGLMDGDGSAEKENRVSFCTTSPEIKSGLEHLIWSFGGTVKWRHKASPSFQGGTGREAWEANIQLPDDVAPFMLPRKASRVSPRTRGIPRRFVTRVELVGREQARCIKVSAEDSLYVAGAACVVTHNTLLSSQIIGRSVGGAADASDFLNSNSSFNKELLEVGLWCIDDGVASQDAQAHQKFSEMVKRAVANPFFSYHAKYRDAQRVEWHGRVMTTLNDDASSIRILPNLDASIEDKIIVLRFAEIGRAFPDWRELDDIIARELPFLLRWLCDWTPPVEIMGDKRFGIYSFIHEDLRVKSLHAGGVSDLLELVDLWIKRARPMERFGKLWRGTASEWLAEINTDDALKPLVNKFTVRQLGRKFVEASRIRGSRIAVVDSKGNGNFYEINLNGEELETKTVRVNPMEGELAA